MCIQCEKVVLPGTVGAKPRVLHCFGGMDLGGAETFVMHVYRSVARDEIQFDFAVSAGKDCYYDDEIKSLGGRIIEHTPPARAGFRRYGDELTKILGKYGPFNAVHSHLHYFSGMVLRIAARERVPVRIAHVHGTQDGRSGLISGYAYHALMRQLIKRFATHILGCSREVLEVMFGKGYLADSRMCVMRNGIALAPYSTVRQDRDELCRKFSIPAGGAILGNVGNFSEAKNHRFLIDVFRRYVGSHPEATLVLVGDGALRHEIEKQVDDLALGKRVRLLGRQPQSDIPGLLNAFDVLVMPSIHEGLPVSLVEAQAAGLPCVVSDAITKEADLNLGLLRFVDPKSSGDKWCSEITMALGVTRPDWPVRYSALQSAGYDVSSSANSLTRIYLNNISPKHALCHEGV